MGPEDPLFAEIFDALEEARWRNRKRIGVRSLRTIRRMKRVMTRKKGAGNALLRKVRKMHHAIRKGPAYNRHR